MIRSAFILTILSLTLLYGATMAQETAPIGKTVDTVEETVSQDPAADLVVVRVSGNPITEKQVIDIINELARQENLTLDQSRQRYSLFFDRAIETLITHSLMRARMSDAGIVVDEAEINAQVQQTAQRFATPEAFQKALADQGLTEAGLRNSLRDNLRMQKVIEEASKGTVQITDSDVEKFYANNPDTFTVTERAHVAHILFKIPPDATAAQKEEIRKRLESIRVDIEAEIITFADAAAKYSQDESTAAIGGDMGFVTRDNLPKPFANAVFNTRMGAVTPALESQAGYHILKALDLRPAGHVTLEEVRTALKQSLEQDAIQSARQKYVEGLKSNATIEFFMTAEEFARRHN